MIFTEAKRYFVERRVNERMAATGATTFASYFAPPAQRPWRRGRAAHQRLHCQRDLLLPGGSSAPVPDDDLLRERILRQARRRVRSASGRCRARPARSPIRSPSGCWRTGRRSMPTTSRSSAPTSTRRCWRPRAAGVFGKRALMRLTPDVIAEILRTARRGDAGSILDDLRGSVRFCAGQPDRSGPDPPHSAASTSSSAATCLIYFDDASRRIAAENLYENLAPGGFICLGHTESMSRISPLFDVRRFADAIVYQRPLDRARG